MTTTNTMTAAKISPETHMRTSAWCVLFSGSLEIGPGTYVLSGPVSRFAHDGSPVRLTS